MNDSYLTPSSVDVKNPLSVLETCLLNLKETVIEHSIAQLGKRENLTYDELTDTYTCTNRSGLKPIEVKMRESQTSY